MSSATIQITKEKTIKFMVMHGIAALIISYIVGYVMSSLGAVTLNAYTAIAVIVGSGLSAVVIAHLKGNLILVGFLAGSLAIGATFIIGSLTGQSSTIGGMMTVLFIGNFISAMIMRKIHKG